MIEAMLAIGSITQGIFGAAGAINQGQAAQEAAQYNSKIALMNAKATREQAISDERRLRTGGAKDIGDIRVGYAASGVNIEGSAMEVMRESAGNIEMDALTLRHRGKTQARIYELESQAELRKGNTAQANAGLSAVGSLLSAGAGAYNALK